MNTPPAPLNDPENAARLPVILVTGLLGAGKTTLLLRWLRESPATGMRLGVVMNEFGAESIDSQLLARPELPIEQVSGGCICCAPDTDIDRAITRLATSGRCDYIVLETSGLADPDNIIDVLTDSDLLQKTQLQAVVTVVDADWITDPNNDVSETILLKKQIQFGTDIALSRCDRLDTARIEASVAAVQNWNSAAVITKMPFGLPDLHAILQRRPVEQNLSNEGEAESGTANEQHLHAQYRSLTWRFLAPIDRARFNEYLSQLDPRDVVRAKGFVRFKDAPEKLYVFQTVRGYCIMDEFPARPHPDPVAVLIGPSLDVERHQGLLRQLVFGKTAMPLRPR